MFYNFTQMSCDSVEELLQQDQRELRNGEEGSQCSVLDLKVIGVQRASLHHLHRKC